MAALVPVDRRARPEGLAAAAGGRRAALADPAAAERATGYVVGGISPLGGRRPLPTVIDAAVRGPPAVYVVGRPARPPAALARDDLVRLTEATVAVIARA